MDALTELCDVMAENAEIAGAKIGWIFSRCPPPGYFKVSQPRVTISQLNALLALARFLAQTKSLPNAGPDLAKAVLEFLEAVPLSFEQDFWPKNFGTESAATFYRDFMKYLAEIADLKPDMAAELSRVVGDILENFSFDGVLCRAFLAALAQDCPRFEPSEAERVSGVLLDRWINVDVNVSLFSSPVEGFLNEVSSPEETTPGSTPGSTPSKGAGKGKEEDFKDSNASFSGSSSSSKAARAVINGCSAAGRSSLDHLAVTLNGLGEAGVALRQQASALQEESIPALERLEVAFRLFGRVLDSGRLRVSHLDKVRAAAGRQLKALPVFLKIRKRDWPEQGAVLKRINTKLSVCQAAAVVQTKSLLLSDSDGKATKSLLRETLALLLDAADACVNSSWRKLRACEELFSSLLSGVAQAAVTCGSQVLRVLLLRVKGLVLMTCVQADMWGNSQGAMFESVTRTCCDIITFGWNKDRAPIESFILALATNIRERLDYGEQEEREKQVVPVVQLNVIRLLADMAVLLNKPEVVEMILPLFIESLEEGDASTPSLLRLRLLDAVARMASLGFEKSYRETIVLLTRSYLDKLSTVGSTQSRTLAPEATTERVETLPAAFLSVACGLSDAKLRSDFRHRLLALCSDVGLAAEAKNGRSGADLLGPLLPSVAEICSDFDPTEDVDPPLLKLFRNLWFYIVLFGLAPPIQANHPSSKSLSTTMNSLASMSAMAIQAVAGPYMWNTEWSSAVQRITQGTPPLVVSSVKWLEDELELNALHNPGSRRSGNEKAASTQRAALSAALGGRVEIASLGTISGVKATYLLAVAFLEVVRFSCNGGLLKSDSSESKQSSAFTCVFKYLETPNLMPAVYQCLTAIVHRAFEAAMFWLVDRISATGIEAEKREVILTTHACFLIQNLSHREEHVREVSMNLLSQLKTKFPQVLWNSYCLDSLLFSVNNQVPSALVTDPSWLGTIRSLLERIVREWIISSLSYAPCTTQGLLQEKFCKLNMWQRAPQATDVISLLSEIKLDPGKKDRWNGIRTANVPAVVAAATAAAGSKLKMADASNLEALSTGSANIKSNYAGEIAGMRRLYVSIGGFQPHVRKVGMVSDPFDSMRNASQLSSENGDLIKPNEAFNQMLVERFVRLLQQYINTAEKGGIVDKALFHETCSQATALLLSDLGVDSKVKVEGFSQLLRLLCWCPAYISTSEAMETGIFVWTWLVSAAPYLGSLVLAELVDAWLWTIDTKRGLFASGIENSGPPAKLRPHLIPGEPNSPLEKNPVEGITSHRLWLGFFLDRFEVVRHDCIEQLLLFGRMLQGSMKSPYHFSCHPAATGAFFTLMLLGLKFCSCQFQNNLQNCVPGLYLLEDRVYRAALGWFALEPEWYESEMKGLAQAEAQSVAVFLNQLTMDRVESPNVENGIVLGNIVGQMDQVHPVWGRIDDYARVREKRKQLLVMLCQHEADRLDVWANPSRETVASRLKISSDRWVEFVRVAFAVDPSIALCLVTRFPSVSSLRAEVVSLVQRNILEMRNIPEALPFFVTPKAVEENSPVLQQLPHWASCSITRALEFLTPAFRGHPRVMAYVLRVLESYPPERVTFFMPQLVQALRYDEGKLVEGYLLGATHRSNLFAHILIWQLQVRVRSQMMMEEMIPAQSREKLSMSFYPLLGNVS
uniref:1-phosphatidylinositol 4-kinase n=1 Tax=Araucaria cunninghamii TaxID=56994 RepID=A0A0D6QSE9_ARACU